MTLNIFIISFLLLGTFSCQRALEKKTLQRNVHEAQSVHLKNSCELLNDKTFTYLPSSKEKLHLFTLKFTCSRDTLKGIIVGPSTEGEHGLFFYKAELKRLVIDDSLNITFFITPGNLYEQRITLENYNKLEKSSGILRSELLFKGRYFADTAIVLNCFSEFYDCYTNEPMHFDLKSE